MCGERSCRSRRGSIPGAGMSTKPPRCLHCLHCLLTALFAFCCRNAYGAARARGGSAAQSDDDQPQDLAMYEYAAGDSPARAPASHPHTTARVRRRTYQPLSPTPSRCSALLTRGRSQLRCRGTFSAASSALRWRPHTENLSGWRSRCGFFAETVSCPPAGHERRHIILRCTVSPLIN